MNQNHKTTARNFGENATIATFFAVATAMISSCLLQATFAQQNSPASPAAEKTRVIYVPFENLNILFDGSSQHVYLSKKEYDELLEKSKTDPIESVPREFFYSSVEHSANIVGSYAVIESTLSVETFRDGLHAIPIGFKNVSIQSASIGDKPAPLGKNANNQTVVFLQGKAVHEIKFQFVSLVKLETARQSVGFQLPTASTAKLSVSVGGNVELSTGPAVLNRTFDSQANRTRFELVPSRDYMSLTMSVNNKKLQVDKSVLAKSVVIHELTSNYEQIHARINVDILYGSTEEVRFGLPADFQITEVTCAEMSQWSIDTNGPGPVLVVQLRKAATKSFSLNIAATTTKITPEAWTLRRLKPIGFDGELSVIGIVAEERFDLQSLSATGLVSLDNQQIQNSIPETVFKTATGAPDIATVAAYFSPDGNYELSAKFTRPEAKLIVKPTSILFLSDQNQKLIGQFELTAENEKIIDFDLMMPTDWRLMSITGSDGTPLSFQRFKDETSTRIKVKIPGGLLRGALNAIVFEAQKTSDKWNEDWSQTEIEFPKFEIKGSELVTGAIAVAVEDDLSVRPKTTSKLETLLKEQKSVFGLDGFNTSIAFEIVESDFKAVLAVERLQPQITATTYSFFQQMTKQLNVHYEVAFDIQTARARELKISLPKSTPSEVRIRGLRGVVLSQTDSIEEGETRIWTLKLSEPRLGEVRIAIDFMQPLESEEVTGFALPTVKALDVGYQTSLFSFEGDSDFDIKLNTEMRPIDVGEMGDAEYIPGPRLLGSFSSVGGDPKFSIDVKRRNIHQLPSAIVQTSTLTTNIAKNGKSQTEAKYVILTKVPFVELKLPESGELWSVQVDGVPTRPQVRGDSVVISMPPDITRRSRELIVFYEDKISSFGLAGKVQMIAPTLLVRNDEKSDPIEVPQADIDWSVTLPTGYAVASNDGSVFTTNEERKSLPFENVFHGVSSFLGNRISVTLRGGKEFNDIASDLESARSGSIDSNRYAEREMVLPAEGYAEDGDGAYMSAEPFGDKDKAESTTRSLEKKEDKKKSLPQFESAEHIQLDDGPGATRELPRDPRKSRAVVDESKSKLGLAKKFSSKGKRGLNIQTVALSFGEETQTFNFKSLSAQPNVAITIVDQDRFHWLSFAYGGLVIAIGLMLCRRTLRAKIGFMMLVIAIAAIVPMLGDWTQVVWRGLENSLYAICFLIFVYCVYAIITGVIGAVRKDIVGWFGNIVHGGRTASILLIAATFIGVLASTRPASAQDNKTTPVEIPSDAIIIPYDPENPDVESEQIFIPYKRYVELTKKSNVDSTLNTKPLIAEFGWSGAEYETTLVGSDLLINGKIRFESFTEKQVAIPLDLNAAVITKAIVDGKPAKLKVAKTVQVAQQVPNQQPKSNQQRKVAQPKIQARENKQLLLYVEGKGQKLLELELRLPIKQVGGWRSVNGQVPFAPASKIEIKIPEQGTEVNYQSVGGASEFVSTVADPNLTIPLGSKGEISLSWRGKISSAKVDQNLSVNSTALFDVRNDGLHLVWNLNFLFRASKRNKFDVELPKDFAVVRVYGPNIRGWEVRNEDTINVLDVTLLSEADSKETFTIELANRRMDLTSATSFPMPTVVIPDAAIHSGQITVRKTNSLELQTDTMIGISRIDLSDARQIKPKSEPLFQPTVFQAFEFSRTPFSVAIQCRPKTGGLEVKTRTLIDIREKSCGMESQLICSSLQPIHELAIDLPLDLDIQGVRLPVGFRKSIDRTETTQTLTLFLAEGLNGTFTFDISGRLADHESTSEIQLPKLLVQNAMKQSGQIAAIAETQLIVQASNLADCTTVLTSQVKAWLSDQNKSKIQVAVNCKSETYSGLLKVTKKPAVVDATSITNVNVTLRSIEESIIINYDIRDNGIDQISFLIPTQLKNAKIKADLIREKSVTPVGDGETPSQYRVTLKLQDFVIGEFRVLVENDFGLSREKQSASIPVLENVNASKRYVTLQNSGFDELLVPDTNEMQNLDRRQKPFRDLKELVGGADIRRGFLTNATANSPLLTYQTNPRKLVQTVGASIGLSEIKMSIDRAGAYRVEQKLFVDNRTEPFLEVELPNGARLWTVKVANAPIKPIAIEGSEHSVRIPLIKTAEGDTDFTVELKYGGSIGKLTNFSSLALPFAKTVGITVNESNLRLYLPEDFDFAFDETNSSLAVSEEQKIADSKAYYQSSVFSRLQSQAKNSKSDLVKQRAKRNLDLQLKQQAVSNAQAIDNLYNPNELDAEPQVDNRTRFNDLLEGQKLQLFGNAGNLSNSYGGNWGGAEIKNVQPTNEPQSATSTDRRGINSEWFDSNGLVNPNLTKQNESNKRFNALEFNAPAQKPLSGKITGGRQTAGRGQEFRSRNGMLGQQGRGEASGNGQGGGGFGMRRGGMAMGGDGKPGGQAEAKSKIAQENFKQQIADNINSLQRQSQSQQGQGGGNKKDAVLQRYAEQLDRGGQNSDKFQLNAPDASSSEELDSKSGQALQGKPNGESRIEPTDTLFSPSTKSAGVVLLKKNSDFVSASLDIEFNHRGKEFLFRTTSNELNLEATVISKSLKRRSTNLFVLLGFFVVFGFAFWICKPKRSATAS